MTDQPIIFPSDAHDDGYEAAIDWCRYHDGPVDSMLEDLRNHESLAQLGGVREFLTAWNTGAREAHADYVASPF